MRAVNAIILDKEKRFLIIKRKQGLHAGKWAFPGGIVEGDEDYKAALKREVKEETGLEILKIIRKISEYDYAREDGENTKGECYLVSVKNQNIKINEEIEDFRWVTLEEFEELEHIPGLEDEALAALF